METSLSVLNLFSRRAKSHQIILWIEKMDGKDIFARRFPGKTNAEKLTKEEGWTFLLISPIRRRG